MPGLNENFILQNFQLYGNAVPICIYYCLHAHQVQKLVNKECGIGVWEFNLRDILRWCELSQVFPLILWYLHVNNIMLT